MCGIAGILASRNGKVDPCQLQHMIDMIRHRGPDECGIYTGPGFGLAHARLSIIDLNTGQQPMHSEDGKLSIIFNGEIFNYLELKEELIQKGHKFLTRSDTEVILHLYQDEGAACVGRFNGQWAFAIWDEPRKRLFLSRDHLGVRPLFYTQTRDRFLFASEIKCFLADPETDFELDLESHDQIFTFWVALPSRTAFKRISQVPPGSSLIVEDGSVRIEKYWSVRYSPEPEQSPSREKQLIEDLFNVLTDATRIRLRSDVPVGAYLSGGLDSTFIAALAHRQVGHRLCTFSLGFDESEFDESPYQLEASRFLGTAHSNLRCSSAQIASVFPDVIWHAEQPILRTAPAALLMLADLVRRNGFKVVLTGEGADEMFGGYDIFKEAKIRRFWSREANSTLRPRLLRRLYPYMDGLQRQSIAYLKEFFQVREDDLHSPFFSHLPRWRLTAKLKSYYSGDVRSELAGMDSMCRLERELPSGFCNWAHFNQAEYLETAYFLPGYILSSQGDRMAMARSVEGRYPFLDHRVVAFAASLPVTLKMKGLNQKYLLKRASDGLVPESIRNRPKQPYRAPDGSCFFTARPDFLFEMLSSERIRQDGIFDPHAVAALVNKFSAGKAIGVKDNMALLGILSTQLLLQQFIHARRGRALCDHRSHQRYAVLS